MKKVLVGFNGLLCGVVLLLTAANLTPRTDGRSPSAVPAARKSAKRPAAAEKTPTAPAQLPSLDSAVEKIIAADVFSNVRSPLANIRGSRGDMTLVGTFKMGEIEGAIIRQTNVQRQMNPFLMQAMMMSGNRGQGGGGNYTRWSAMGGNNRPSNVPVKQYVRVGETMTNGYVLVEVSRTRAVLVRGNDKMELELQDPSKNRASGSRAAGPRLNATQQFQQAQMFMQSQMLRTLQNMQRGGGAQNAPPANRGRR